MSLFSCERMIDNYWKEQEKTIPRPIWELGQELTQEMKEELSLWK